MKSFSLDLTVKLVYCLFHNESNGYYIFKAVKIKNGKSQGLEGSDPIILVFDKQPTVPPVKGNVTINCTVTETTHAKYGKQFKVQKWSYIQNDSNSLKIIKSIPKFGDKSAVKLMNYLKKQGQSFMVWVKCQVSIYVELINPNKHNESTGSLRCICSACKFLVGLSRKIGLSIPQMETLFKHYEVTLKDEDWIACGLVPEEIFTIKLKKKEKEIILKPLDIRTNPWILKELIPRKFTIRRCDEIGRFLQFPADHKIRIRQHALETLKKICQMNGHTFYWFKDMIVETHKSLSNSIFSESVSKTKVNQIIVNDDSFVLAYHPSFQNMRIVFSKKVYDRQQDLCSLLKTKFSQKNHFFNSACNSQNSLLQIISKDIRTKIQSFIPSQSDFSISNGLIKFEIDQFESQNKISFDIEQYIAIKAAIQNKATVITGGPGMGKTTIVRTITKIISEYLLMKPEYTASDSSCALLLTSFTGQAVRRLRQVVCGSEYQQMRSDYFMIRTMHSFLLSQKLSELVKNNIPIILVIDELSMVSEELFFLLLNKMKDSLVKIILVGDKDQLPSIDPGRVLRDIIDSNCFPTITLKTIHRQNREGTLVINANMINRLRNDQYKDAEFSIVKRFKQSTDFVLIGDEYNITSDSEYCQKIQNIVSNIKQENASQTDYLTNNTLILTPFRKHRYGKYYLDNSLRKFFNPNSNNHKYKLIIKKGAHDVQFFVGDRVIATKNDYDRMIFNGQPGVIIDFVDSSGIYKTYPEQYRNYSFYSKTKLSYKFSLSKKMQQINEKLIEENNKKRRLEIDVLDRKFNTAVVRFDDIPTPQLFIAEEVNDIEVHFASTVHKAQGDEYQQVVVFMPSGFSRSVTSRELIYTAITRAKKCCYLVGNHHSITKCINNIQSHSRLSILKEKLQDTFKIF